MGGEAREVSLGETTELLTGHPFKSDEFSDAPPGLRLLRGDNVVQGQTRWDGAKYWPHDVSAAVDTYRLRAGDVVLAMDRPWIEAGLKHATLTGADCPSLLVQRVARLRAREGLDQRFLGYVIRSADFTNYVLGVQTGTAVPHISGGQIKAYRFGLPPLRVQQQAAEVLGAIDDKIELNRRMAGTLEAMARALFQSWFVDFDPVRAKAEGRPTGLSDEVAALFPNKIGGDGMPEGWHLGRLSDLLDNNVHRVRPSEWTRRNPYVPIDAIAAKSLTGIELRNGSLAQSSLVSFARDDILFGAMRPYFHKVAIAPSEGTTRTTVFTLRPKEMHDLAYGLLLVSETTTIDFANNGASGSTIPYATWDNSLATMPTLLAPKALRTAFGSLVEPMLRRAQTNVEKSRTLAALRDALLPKLISGELRVGDVAEISAA